MNIHIYDNEGKTFDRYTAVYLNEPTLIPVNGDSPGALTDLYNARGMSEHPFHPQGFGQMCSAMDGEHLGERIEFDQLPPDCQKLVLSDYTGK